MMEHYINEGKCDLAAEVCNKLLDNIENNLSLEADNQN